MLRFLSKSLRFSVICLAVAGVFGSRPTLAEDLPVDREAPKNLARLNCGAQLNVSGQASPTKAADTRTLLLDDQTLDYQLRPGDTSFVITLPKISLVDRFTFINEEAQLKGTVQVAVSNARPGVGASEWQSAGRETQLNGTRFVNVPLTGLEAKYIRVTFRVDHEGTIAGIGLYGRKTLESFSQQRPRGTEQTTNVAYTLPTGRAYDGLHYNFANLYARARVVYVSSGSLSLAQRTIDDDPATGFEFAVDDRRPTIVLQLAESQRLRRISAVYEMQAGQLEVFLLDRIPGDTSAPNLDQLRPVLTLTDEHASGKAAADFEPRGARFIALRWTRLGAATKAHTFGMCEIGAFSDNRSAFAWVDMAERLASVETNLPPSPPLVIPPVVPVSP